jgi:hypothetical protein
MRHRTHGNRLIVPEHFQRPHRRSLSNRKTKALRRIHLRKRTEQKWSRPNQVRKHQHRRRCIRLNYIRLNYIRSRQSKLNFRQGPTKRRFFRCGGRQVYSCHQCRSTR